MNEEYLKFLKDFEININYSKTINKEFENFRENKVLEIENVLIAFWQMTRNLINVYSFYVEGKTKEQLIKDCVKFLQNNISKFKIEKNSKAHSYFVVLAKSWLVQEHLRDKKRREKEKVIKCQ